jgi:hypothetical protein
MIYTQPAPQMPKKPNKWVLFFSLLLLFVAAAVLVGVPVANYLLK